MASKSLVIVESPAKAKTIEKYLGADFKVMASVGHVVDLPSSPLGVDVANAFALTYEVTKPKVIAELKAALKNADALYLATDEDREGEAIAWHLLNQLKPKVPVHRMVFHEITRKAILAAVEQSRGIDEGLVDAQEARRTLDRLYGYEVSPVLWRKIGPRLSAGRVQSPALRLIVERELERMRFRSASYWDVSARHATSPAFTSTLTAVDGRRLATGKDFDAQGALSSEARPLDEATARALATGLEGRPFKVRSLEKKGYRSSPKPPFITSTMQQEGGRKLRLSAQQVMRLAQGLYERGYITYMRTDSTTLSATALSAARTQIGELFGKEYLPAQPRHYVKKAKNAQEAHEAIRPAGDSFRTPDQVRNELGGGEFRLYELIWQRTVASQMNDARGESVQVRLGASTHDGRDALFAASGRTILFPGFLRAYVEGTDDPDAALDDQERILPEMAEGDAMATEELAGAGHETQPPARFTEASLVKRLEELGVGRPSTYASIISTVQDRGYVWKKGSALVPSFTAFAVITLLEQHFPDLVDYAFTARMEDDLDEIASGSEDVEPWLTRFYFGVQNGNGGADHTSGLALKTLVSDLGDIDAREVNSIPLGADSDGVPIVARVGRYGPYLERGSGDDSQRASIPDEIPPDELTVERAVELLEAPSGDRELGTHPSSGETVYLKAGRFGPYVQEGLHDDETGFKPRTASLFRDMDPATVTLDDVLPLLELPREVGVDPADGVVITAQNGRYGPYIKKGSDSRSLETEQQILSLTIEQALVVMAQPKRGRGQGAAKPPLKELGPDPDTERPIVVKDGRFGPYVTDGETNASLRKGDDVEDLTMERALELLADRRARGPVKKKAGAKKKAPAKKKAGAKKKATAAKKKAGAKKKAPAKKKATAKKAAADHAVSADGPPTPASSGD